MPVQISTPRWLERFVAVRLLATPVLLRTCLGLALDPAYIKGFVEECPKGIGADDPDEEQLFRDLREETQGKVLIESLKADCEVRTGGATLE